MRHEPRICEDDGWPAHCTDDVTFHNTQGHAITISQNPSSQWPFDPPAGDPRYHIRAHGTADCKIASGLSTGPHSYFVDGCPPRVTPRTVIIS